LFARTTGCWSNGDGSSGDADAFAGGECDAFAEADAYAYAGGECDAFAGGECDAFAEADAYAFAGGECDAFAGGECDAHGQSNGRRRRRSHTRRRSDNRHYCGWAYGWLLLHDKENVTTQRGQNKYVEVNKGDVYNRILELDIRKMEKRHERHIWHIKSMWGGVAGILLAVYVVLTSQYLYGNAVLVRGDNYVLAGGAVLISIALCYGLMWIGVIREYNKFEAVINEKIRYYESAINAPLSAQLSRD
jgi:hypothetical protein